MHEEIEERLRWMGTHLQNCGRWSLHDHLVATYNALVTWDQPEYVQIAGLLHRAYIATGSGAALFNEYERFKLQELIGVKAERLVYYYKAVVRRELINRAFQLAASSDAAIDEAVGNQRTLLARSDVTDLLMIHLASLAVEAGNADGSPSSWLTLACELTRLARSEAKSSPAILELCDVDLTKPREDLILSRYASVTESQTDWKRAIRELERVIDDVDIVGEPHILVALAAIAEGDFESGEYHAAQARELFETWGVQWDKRLSHDQWLAVCSSLEHICVLAPDHREFVGRQLRLALFFRPLRPEFVYSWLDSNELLVRSKGASSRLPERFVDYVERLPLNGANPLMRRYGGIETAAWFRTTGLDIVKELERYADDIRLEMEALDSSEFQPENERVISREGDWSVFFFYERGRRNQANCNRCPRTSEILDRNRTIKDLGGLAYFSRLSPGTRVAPHFGPTDMRVRCHLGLKVPDGCGLRVGGHERSWELGRCIIFDDSFLHEVWNESDEDRVVLVVDLWHPDLSELEVALLEGLHRYAQAHADNLQSYWTANENDRIRNRLIG